MPYGKKIFFFFFFSRVIRRKNYGQRSKSSGIENAVQKMMENEVKFSFDEKKKNPGNRIIFSLLVLVLVLAFC